MNKPLHTSTGGNPLDNNKPWTLDSLLQANQEFKDARKAALNLMEDAILSEKAMRESEAKYRFLYQSIDQGVIVCTLVRDHLNAPIDIYMLHVNPAWETIAKMPAADMIQKKALDILPDLTQSCLSTCDKVQKNEQPVRFEATLLDKNRWFDIYICPTEHDQFMILLTDITERKIREFNQAFLADFTASLINLPSVDEIVRVVGQKLSLYLGISACAFINIMEEKDECEMIAKWEQKETWSVRGIYKISHCIGTEYKKSIHRGIPLVVKDIVADDGVNKDIFGNAGIRTVLNLPIIRNGNWVFLFSACHREIYEWQSDKIEILRQLAERLWNKVARVHAEEKLRQSEENYKAIVNQSIAGIFKIDLNGHMIFTNEQFVKMLDYTRDQLLQLTVKDIVHPEDLDKTNAAFTRLVEDGKSFEIEKRLIRSDGTVLWVTNHISPLYDAAARPIGAVGVSIDITRQKAVEQQKDEFISIASHELKTPLTSIKAFGQLVSQSLKDEKNASLGLIADKMNHQIDKLVNLVYTILDTTRIERQVFVLNLSSFNIEDLLNEKITESRLIAPNYTITIEKCDNLLITADKVRLGQVLNNLLSNAIKYSEPYSNIIITCEHSGDDILIKVKDEGMGIAEKELTRIFERFYRSDDNQKAGRAGIGLGLYISAQIIKSHNGTIGVTSELEKGSTFYFTVPGNSTKEK